MTLFRRGRKCVTPLITATYAAVRRLNARTGNVGHVLYEQPIPELFDDLLTAVGQADQIKKQCLRLLDGK